MSQYTQEKQMGIGRGSREKNKNKNKNNGDAGYRSPCPSHAKRMLYHLSYIPTTSSISNCLSYSFSIKMHPVGFEPTHLSIAELNSAPLDHSGTNAFYYYYFIIYPNLFFRPTYLLFIYTLYIYKNYFITTLPHYIIWR